MNSYIYEHGQNIGGGQPFRKGWGGMSCPLRKSGRVFKGTLGASGPFWNRSGTDTKPYLLNYMRRHRFGAVPRFQTLPRKHLDRGTSGSVSLETVLVWSRVSAPVPHGNDHVEPVYLFIIRLVARAGKKKQSCAVIGYLRGLDRAILPSRDCLLPARHCSQ